MSVIVIELITLDGIVNDPDAPPSSPGFGWASGRHGATAVSADGFRIGPVLENAVLLLGRGTWQMFCNLWPNRDNEFAKRMNAAPKLVATRTLTDVSAWQNSTILDVDPVEAVRRESRDVIVSGSPGLVRALAAEDLVDEYRLMTYPTIAGAGERLFPSGGPAAQLDCAQVEQDGPAVYSRYVRAR